MNNEDYIRKAVELADGFEWDAERDVIIYTQYGQLNCARDEPMCLDHLAAQLVRQVERKGYAFESNASMQSSVGLVKHVSGNDRTMNTIKAIVDSGVLDERSD